MLRQLAFLVAHSLRLQRPVLDLQSDPLGNAEAPAKQTLHLHHRKIKRDISAGKRFHRVPQRDQHQVLRNHKNLIMS